MSITISIISLSGETLFTFNYDKNDNNIISLLHDTIQQHYKYYYQIKFFSLFNCKKVKYLSFNQSKTIHLMNMKKIYTTQFVIYPFLQAYGLALHHKMN